ncbi:MAG: hypothetical protein FJ098_04210 [Deltaproteobacteria bacterium]|nr:hypothetical protein [Deltaproteobacteria bacterium]
MRLRMLVGALALSLAVSGCGLIKEKVEEATGEKSEEKKAEEEKAAQEAEAAKKAAEEAAKKAAEEKAALEAEKAKLLQEKQAAEEAARKAEAEKLEAEKKQITEALAALSSRSLETRMALKANLAAWEGDGATDKVTARTTFLAEYEKIDGELAGIKAYLMQDDLAKARTGLDTLKGTCEALGKQAEVVLADAPQALDGSTRAKVLDLIAAESCLQKAIAEGTLTEADLGVKRAELLAAAGVTAEQYDKLREKLARKPEPTDAMVLQSLMEQKCPAAAPDPRQALMTRVCDHAVGILGPAFRDKVPEAELEGRLVQARTECLADLAPLDAAMLDRVAACALAATDLATLDPCNPKKMAEAPVEGAPVEGAPVEGTPVEGTVEGTPVEGTVEGTPVEGTVEGTPVEGTVEGTPVEGAPAEPLPPTELKPGETKPAAAAVTTNMKFTGSIQGHGRKAYAVVLNKRGSKASGTVWHGGGKIPVSGSFSAKGASFSGGKGKNQVNCTGKLQGSNLVGQCSGGLSGKFTLRGK